MNPECFSPFEEVNYPCYWLGGDGSLLMNDAARAAALPLSDENGMRRLLQTSLQEVTRSPQLGAHTLPLLTDALSMRTLTLMPAGGGILAIACDEMEAPVNAFSSAMREPLTNIFAVLPLLAAHVENLDLRYAEDIQANCYQLLRLASNLENGSRIEKKLFDLQPVDGTSLAESLCYCIESVCKDQGVPITWQLPDAPQPIRADPHLLSEVFLNIVRNSLQFTRDGNQIHVRLENIGSRALLTIEDKGIGIKPEHIDRIFEPYYSVDPYGDTGMRPGLGLGLSVVRQTVNGFGGSVNVESRFGEGTSIHTSLPMDTTGGEVLGSGSAEYLLNRYSPVYVQLCGYCRLPGL